MNQRKVLFPRAGNGNTAIASTGALRRSPPRFSLGPRLAVSGVFKWHTWIFDDDVAIDVLQDVLKVVDIPGSGTL